jgi:tetratricopeptide (TPR) repeat protein
MDLNSGLSFLNYPVSEAGIDAGLLSGFIQANITYSESGRVSETNSTQAQKHHFFEFQYQDFNLLLKNGDFVRVCLILDQKASSTMKTIVYNFLDDFEKYYRTTLLNLQRFGVIDFEGLEEYIADAFDVQLMFPMVLTHTIAPDVLEEINKNNIQTAILKFAKDFLASKPFFFIYSLLNQVKDIVNLESKIVLYEIYQLLKMRIVIPTTIETAESSVKTFQEAHARKIAHSQVISHIIHNENELNELKERATRMDEDSARKAMLLFIKKGKTAEKAKIFQEAQKEYEKALYLASGFNFQTDIGKISFMIIELDKINSLMEIEYAMNAGESAEKKKNYIDAIRHFKKVVSIFENEANPSNSEARIKKIQKRIAKLQSNI